MELGYLSALQDNYLKNLITTLKAKHNFMVFQPQKIKDSSTEYELLLYLDFREIGAERGIKTKLDCMLASQTTTSTLLVYRDRRKELQK